MKIVQRFWTGDTNNRNKKYGWHSAKSHYLGWVLSSNQLSKYYDVETSYRSIRICQNKEHFS